MAQKINKIYDIQLQGEKDLLKKMQVVNAAFDTAKAKFQSLKSIAGNTKIVNDAELQKEKQALLEVEKALLKETIAKKEAQAASVALQTARINERNETAKLSSELHSSVGAYKELNNEYKVAKQRAMDIGAAKGVESEQFKRASAEALNYYNRLKAIDAGVGVFSRNVGNYPKTTNLTNLDSAAIQNLKNSGLGQIIAGQVNQAKNSVKQLDAELIVLKSRLDQLRESGVTDLDAIERQIIENRQAAEKYRQEIQRVQNELRGLGSTGAKSITNLNNHFNSLKGQITSVAVTYLSFQAAFAKTQELVTNTAELSDQVTNLEIELGKAAGGAQKLVDQLAQINTRTPLVELVNMANIAVKAGVEESDLVGVVKAVDQIKTAFGKDFGDVEEGTESLVKLINVFEGEGNVTEEKLLKMGNAIRVLANESVASVPFLNDFSKRMAGLKGISEISLPSVLGLASGFEQFGQSAETSSTALVRIIPKLASDTAKFAKIAGMTRKEFSQLINTNPAEALIRVAEGIAKNKGSIEELIQSLGDSELAKKGGAGIVSALGVLGKNAETFRNSIKSAGEAYEDTSDITEAFEKKNQNFAASLDMIKKRFADLSNNQKLLKAFSAFATIILTTTQFITNIPFGWWIAMLTFLTLAYYENIKALVLNIYQQTIFIARQAIGNALIAAGTIILRAQAIAIGIANAAWTILNATMLFFGSIIPGIRAAWISLNITLALTPVGFILGGIVAIGAGLVLLSERSEAAANSMKKQGAAVKQTAAEMKINAEITKRASEATSDTIAKVDTLTKVVKDNSISLDTRKKALQELININPKYLNGLTLENIKTAEGVKILEAYKNKIIEVAKAKAAQQLLEEKSKRLFELEMQAADDAAKALERQRTKGEIFNANAWKQDLKEVGGLLGFGEGDDETKFNNRLKERIELQKEINVLTGKVVDNLKKGNIKNIFGGATDEEEEKKEKKYTGSKLNGYQKDYLKDLEATRNQQLAILERSFLKGLISEEEYIKGSLKINSEYYDKKIAYLKGGNAEERKQVAQAQLDKVKAERETNDKLFNLFKKRADDELKVAEQTAKDKLEQVQKNPYSTEMEKLEAEKTYYQESTDAQIAYNQKMLDLNAEYSKMSLSELDEMYRQLNRKIQEENQNNLQSRIRSVQITFSVIDQTSQDLSNQNSINSAIQRKNILNDKSISIEKKKIELQKISDQLELQNINTELGNANARIATYELELNTRKLTNDEMREYNKLLLQRAQLEADKAQAEANVRISGATLPGNGLPGSGTSGLASSITNNLRNSDGQINIGGSDYSEQLGYAIAQAFDTATLSMNNYFDAERNRIEQSKQLAYERIDLEKNQLLRFAQSSAERESIERQAAEKKKKADKEAGEKLKKTKKAEAKIAFLMELANIWSSVWSIGNPIAAAILGGALTVLAGVRYASTIKGIDSTQYKRGGQFLGKGGKLYGPSHSKGGMPVYNPITGEKVAEMEGKEGIINAKSMSDNSTYTVTGTPSQIASKINSIGGGVDWYGGATIKKYESGGVFNWNRTQPPVFNSYTDQASSTVNMTEVNERMDRVEKMLSDTAETLNKEVNRKTVLNPNDVTNYQNEKRKQSEIATL